MRYNEFSTIKEATIEPDHEMIAIVSDILDNANAEYSSYLDQHNDADDIDFLADILNELTEEEDLPIQWLASDSKRADPNEWISAAAGVTGETEHLDVFLWKTNLEGKWGPASFKETVLQMLAHETIHFNQYKRIGYDNLSKIQSGHQKGTILKAKTGKERDWMRSYLRDPHELMAYAHDLAGEMKHTDDPQQALRNPESYRNELQVYNMFRDIFPPNAKPLQRLLSYAARYLK